MELIHKSKHIKTNSFLLAVYILETLVCQIITHFISIANISVILMAGILLSVIMTNRIYESRKIIRYICAFLVIGLILMVSIVLNGTENAGNYGVYFLTFGSTSLILLCVPIDIQRLFLYLVRISFLYSIAYLLLFRTALTASDSYWLSQMGYAYGFLIPVIVSLIYLLRRDYVQTSRFGMLIVIVNLIIGLLCICIDCATRGAILAVVVAIFLLLLSNVKSTKRMVLFILAALMVTICILNIQKILILLYGFLASMNINIPALSKSIWMIERGIADNGRVERYQLAFSLFKQSPIIGHGVGYYENITGGSYGHNIVLELLCEYGIIGTIPILFTIAKGFVRVFIAQTQKTVNIIFYELLFLITIPLLTFSSSYWLLPSFWIYFWSLLSCENRKN